MEKVIDLMKGLHSENDKLAYKCLRDLQSISANYDSVYEYMDVFIEMLSSENSYIRTRGLILISANAKWDTENKVDGIMDKYLSHVTDKTPITARQCIKALPLIIKSKPQFAEDVVAALNAVNLSQFPESMQSLIRKERTLSLKKIQSYYGDAL